MEFNVHFGEIIKTYNNMFEDGTWKREIGKKDVIIALSTKVAELQAKLETQDKRVQREIPFP